MSRILNRGLLLLTVALFFVLGTNCHNAGDGDIDNEECEGDCTTNYLEQWTNFLAELPGCVSDCVTADDMDCVLDCEDGGSEYDQDFLLCMADCPCINEQNSCNAGCDTGDDDCLMDCTNGYHDCAGAESPYHCITLCSMDKTDCLAGCQNSYLTVSEYTTCSTDCNSEFIDCIDVCVPD